MAKKNYEVPALVITPEKAPAVTGNFEDMKKCLLVWRRQVQATDLTEDNIEQVRLIKRAVVTVRNRIEDEVTAAKKRLFNDPKKLFEALVKPLSTLVNEIEAMADEVLDKEEQERIRDINQVLDGFKAKFQEKYALDGEHLARIEYKKGYYNKTAVEKQRKDDLEQQFKDLKKEQDAHAANIRLIQAACRDDPRLNAEHWAGQLQYDGIAVVIEAIEQEKKRLAEIDNPEPSAEAAGGTATLTGTAMDAPEKLIIGVAEGLDFTTDFPGREKTMVIKLTYPCDLADAITELFKRLREHGIKCRPVEETVF
jgi:hypothetical protein